MIKLKKIETIIVMNERILLLIKENIERSYLSKDTSDRAISNFLSKTCVNASLVVVL